MCQPGAMRCRSPTQSVPPGSIAALSLISATETFGANPVGAFARGGEPASAGPARKIPLRMQMCSEAARSRIAIAVKPRAAA